MKMDEDKKSIICNAIAVFVCVIFLFPLYWMVRTSLTPEGQIFITPPVMFPVPPDFTSYLNQLSGQDYNIIKAFFNSVIISLSTMAVSVIFAIPASYALARFKIRGKNLFIFVFLVTQMLPAIFILTPLFILFKNLGLFNTYFAPIIANSTGAIAFAVIILRTYFASIPKELDDSARIDGCNSFQAFVKIFIPIAFPGVIVATVFSFLNGWGDMVNGLTFINDQNLWPITTGIYNYLGQYSTLWARITAFGVITVIPVVLIFIFMQKYIVSGLTSGAVKG